MNQTIQIDPLVPEKVKVPLDYLNTYIQMLAVDNYANSAEYNPTQTAISVTTAVVATVGKLAAPVSIFTAAYDTLNRYYSFVSAAAISLANGLVEDAKDLSY